MYVELIAKIAWYGLAVYRITQAITRDEIFSGLRNLFVDHDKAWEYINCPMCVSVWAALGAWVFCWLFPGLSFLIDVCAIAGAVSLLFKVAWR